MASCEEFNYPVSTKVNDHLFSLSLGEFENTRIYEELIIHKYFGMLVPMIIQEQ